MQRQSNTRTGVSPLPPAYCDYIRRGDWDERNREFADSGVKVFHIQLNHGDGGDYYTTTLWPLDNVFREDEAGTEWSVDRQAEAILTMQPKARFMIKFLTAPPLDFTEKHADHMQTDEDGKTYRQPSYASPLNLKQLSRHIRNLIRYCEGRTWGDRILGYLGMPMGEGIMPLLLSGKMFDCSAVNEQAFRAWVKREYTDIASLREVWGEPDLAFDEVRVPRDRDWKRRRTTDDATIGGRPLSAQITNCGVDAQGLFHWTETANSARERDYCRFMRDQFLHWNRTVCQAAADTFAELGVQRLFALDTVKQPQIGWQIQSSFDGIGDGQTFPSMFLLNGSWNMGELLDDDTFRAVWNPGDYFARSLGFAYESEGVTDSLVLRGKTPVVENDARTYVGAGVNDQGAFRDIAEVEAGLLRNEAMVLSRGLSSYWCNVGSSYFHDCGIQRVVAKILRTVDRVRSVPRQETEHAIAFVVDDAGPLYEDFTSGYQSLALILQRVRGLAHCGVPYRIYLLSDLANADFPRYRTWLFPNLFRVDDEVRALLDAKVLRDGNVAIFGPATGITDGTHLGAEGASALLGVGMELLPRTTVRHVLVRHYNHPITGEQPANLIYGDSMPYGPTLVPGDGALEQAGAVSLGHANACWFINRPGLFIKEFGKGAASNGACGDRGTGDYAVVWSLALPLPASLLRACARYAGSNVWCEEDDVIYASDSVVALHSTKSGSRTINLPRPCEVTDAVTGRPCGKGPRSSIRLRINAPQTRVFMLT